MDLAKIQPAGDGEMEETDSSIPILENNIQRTHFPGMVRKKSYVFDGSGNYCNKEWDLAQGSGKQFCWYHVVLPKGKQKLSQSAQYLIEVLCPPLKLQDILSLVSNGPFCGHVDGALVFRVNSPGPPSSNFTFRLAARVTENSVITVSLGRVPRLGFSPIGRSLLSEIPSVESPNCREDRLPGGGIVIREHVLEFLLTMNHSEEADNPVPKSVSNLVVHIVDMHVDLLQDVVTKLEMDLDSVELELDREKKCSMIPENASQSAASPAANRVTAIQASLDSWQSEQINRKLYNLYFLSVIFLPLSVITGVFGMNVGGVPWTVQKDPALKYGFRNVMFLCLATLILVLLCFIFPALYSRLITWHRRRSLRRSWSHNGDWSSREAVQTAVVTSGFDRVDESR
ncbi:heat shock 70 kDa protein [Hibiscus syriacus]|uniref:Heat shock 70 kDa protein n=1 Tax=Hibiscus syriacus TaxID=106335 RepID=A0A6A2Z492_HIBSY|nr:heat shock 70 kDa protein [Hibiscus syriacus]